MPAMEFESTIWLPVLQDVWTETKHMKRLSDVADIHRGIEYNVPFRKNESKLVSDTELKGFHPGIHRVRDTVEPFLIRKKVFLNMSSRYMRGSAHKYEWGRPKLFVNAARRTRGAWPIAASIDDHGVVCYQNFHAVWPRSDISLESLAAILSGPVANAFVATREGKRDVQKRTLLGIPIPDLSLVRDERIAELVQQYRKVRMDWLQGAVAEGVASSACLRLLRRIDAEVLSAYDLSPRSERELLDYFAGEARPVPFAFNEYFPDRFKPYLSWHRYLSREIEEATATATMRRLPVIDDPLITGTMEYLRQDSPR